MISKIKKYIVSNRDDESANTEQAIFMNAIRHKKDEYEIAKNEYDSIMSESKDSRLHELAYDLMKVKERQLSFMLSIARETDIRAGWDDVKIS